jgi:hypothetical protein
MIVDSALYQNGILVWLIIQIKLSIVAEYCIDTLLENKANILFYL